MHRDANDLWLVVAWLESRAAGLLDEKSRPYIAHRTTERVSFTLFEEQ